MAKPIPSNPYMKKKIRPGKKAPKTSVPMPRPVRKR